MDGGGRTSSEAESSAGRRSFSQLRSRLSAKNTRPLGEDASSSIDTAEGGQSRKMSEVSKNSTPSHSRNHSRNQSVSSYKQVGPPLEESHKPIPTASQLQSQSHTEIPPPLLPKVTPRTLENPLSVQTPSIVKFFVGSSIVLLFIGRFLHWSVGLTLSAILAYVLYSQLNRASSDAEWEKEDRRRHVQANEGPQNETVEWMNSILKTVWPLITQDYFVPFVDLLEDSLMQLVPPIVHSCRVEDLDQGTVPLRIQSFIVLDSHEDAFTRGTTQVHCKNLQQEESGEETEPLDVGDYVNLELTFAYRSPAARCKKKKSNKGASVTEDSAQLEEKEDQAVDSDLPVDQIHLLIYMAIGLQKIAAVEVPVWCEILGIEGRMRLRLQLVPTAPFVARVAFTFIGMPKLEISAKPLGRRMVIDAMHLPLISSYVLHSVEAVVKNFMSPKSYTMDIAGLLGAGDGPNNVYALGVVILVLHQGIDLPAADVNGLCDPFVSVSFARAGKTLFTTRIIVKSRNAIWQEMAVLLVSVDEVRDHERLRLTVFDADRFSADDPLGKMEVSIDKLIHRALLKKADPEKPMLMECRTDNLLPMRKGGESVKGQLKYSVGFYHLSRPTVGNRSPEKQGMLQTAAKREENEKKQNTVEEFQEADSLPTDGTKNSRKDEKDDSNMAYATPFDRFIHSIGLPLDPKVLQHRKERKERVNKLVSLMEGEKKATFGPPDKRFASGILAFHIHSIDALGFEGTQRSFSNSKRLGQKPQYSTDDDGLGEGTSKMPNSYVQVVLNDEAIFRTRTKTLNPRPFINAGTERFVSDFNTARIDFIVRDARLRENDPILGIAGLKLSKTLVDSSRSTQYYTLTGGLGWGKIRITLLWRSVEIKIPKQLRGWNVGVVEVAKCSVSGIAKVSFERKGAHMMFETVGGRAETESVEPFDEYESGEGKDATIGFQWPLKEPVRIAVRQRYPNFLYIHLRSDSRVPGRVHKHAHTVVSLSRLIDGEEAFRRVPIFETNDWQRFEQDILGGMALSDDSRSSLADNEEDWQPVLEKMCNPSHFEYPDLPSEIRQDGHIQKIGYLDITLVYHPGVTTEHKSLTAGDHEMRIAYDSFTTLVDAGERPKPKMVSATRRRKLSLSTGLPSEVSKVENGTLGAEKDNPDEDLKNVRQVNSSGASGSEYEDDDDGSGVDEDGNFVDVNTAEGRRARAGAKHRQHRGAAQIKGFRTLDWIRTNVEDGVGHVKRTAQQKRSKRIAKMENEGVSHF